MAKHRVVVHTRTLRLTLHAEFDSAAIGEQWASRLHQARVSGSAITLGGVRVSGCEILRVEHGPAGGTLRALGAVDPLTGIPADDEARAVRISG